MDAPVSLSIEIDGCCCVCDVIVLTGSKLEDMSGGILGVCCGEGKEAGVSDEIEFIKLNVRILLLVRPSPTRQAFAFLPDPVPLQGSVRPPIVSA
jgi:hypothetical protein